MQGYRIIQEEEAAKLLTIPLAISVIEKCFLEKARGAFKAHPKINIKGANGDLRITPGESLETFKAIGFRLYDVISTDFSHQPQMIVVYDNETGRFKGMVLSQLLGAYRTAAINACMQKHFQKAPIDCLGIVGTGFQARIHTLALDHVLQPQTIKIYGRTEANLDQFINEMQSQIPRKVNIEKCLDITDLKEADSLLLATRSKTSLLDENIFNKPMVITTIGPKIKGSSEVSNTFALSCDLIISDSLEQVITYGDRFFIEDLTKVVDFADLLKGNASAKKHKRVLLCSVGMGGTEVALANELLASK